MADIHPTAVIDRRAELAADVQIGPYCVVERDVTIQEGCQLASHVVIRQGVTLGAENQIYDGAVIGGRPQHLKAGAAVGRLRIGRANTIREFATLHCALQQGEQTVVGDHNLIMVNAHVGHDCQVGNHTILVNGVLLGGHVTVEDRAYISGGVGIHQFCRIGKYAMIGGLGRITQDVPPYVLVDGLTRHVVGLNIIGLRRNGFRPDQIAQLKAAYRVIYRSGLAWADVLTTLAAEFPSGPAAAFREFFQTSARGYVREPIAPSLAALPIAPADASDADSAARLGRAA